MKHPLALLFSLLVASLLVTGCPTGDDDDDDAFDMQTLVDQTYLLDLTGGGFEYTQPEDVGSLIGSMWPSDRGTVFAATALDEGAGTVDFLIASAGAGSTGDYDGWSQGELPTVTTAGTLDGMAFEGGPLELEFDMSGDPLMLWDVIFGGTFVEGGAEVTGAYLEATIDLLPYDTYLGLDDGSLCETLAQTTDAECSDCPAGAPNEGPFCLFVSAENGLCPLLTGLVLSPVD